MSPGFGIGYVTAEGVWFVQMGSQLSGICLQGNHSGFECSAEPHGLALCNNFIAERRSLTREWPQIGDIGCFTYRYRVWRRTDYSFLAAEYGYVHT